MHVGIIGRLLEINRDFYRQNARSFSATRRRLQPGVQRLVGRLLTMTPPPRLLDLGCGNGQLAAYLADHGFAGEYLGLDASPDLLTDARRASPYPFIEADLSSPGWDAILADRLFDVVLAFAVLHHLPGSSLRLDVLGKIHDHLASQAGLFIHSEWQFANSPRLSGHTRPWSETSLQASDVDEGDALLDWRAEGSAGLRYVHSFNENELAGLAGAAHFKILESFYSDGRENTLGLYQLWSPTSPLPPESPYSQSSRSV